MTFQFVPSLTHTTKVEPPVPAEPQFAEALESLMILIEPAVAPEATAVEAATGKRTYVPLEAFKLAVTTVAVTDPEAIVTAPFKAEVPFTANVPVIAVFPVIVLLNFYFL